VNVKTTLQLPANLWRVQAFAECAIWEGRPDLQQLCKAVPDQGGMSVDLIVSELPGLSETGYRNIFRHLQYLRLIGNGDDGRLTRMGAHCAATGSAPVWEMGVYDLLVAHHPVIGSPILEFRRTTGTSGAKFKSLVGIPEWLELDGERVATSVYNASSRFSVHRFPRRQDGEPMCQCSELAPAVLDLDIDLETGCGTWEIAGSAEDFGGAFRSNRESLPQHYFAGIIAKWDRRWNRSAGYVAIAYDGNADGGRESFRRVMAYENVTAADFIFPKVVVKDVPVGPSSAEEARKWAVALAAGSLADADAYVTADGFARTWQQVVGPTRLQVAPIAIADVVNDADPRTAARTRWLLAAATDLAIA